MTEKILMIFLKSEVQKTDSKLPPSLTTYCYYAAKTLTADRKALTIKETKIRVWCNM